MTEIVKTNGNGYDKFLPVASIALVRTIWGSV